MLNQSPKFSTIVRLIVWAPAAAATLGGCATPASPRSGPPACGPAAIAVCETFGPERACGCESRADLGVLKGSLDGPAWRGDFTR